MPGRRAIFITGGASGIGRACAERFSREGWFVGIYDIDVAGAAMLALSLGSDNACSGKLDVRDAGSWSGALAAFWEHGGARLDVLFNNAGIVTAGPFAETSLERHLAMVQVNVIGTITGCHLAHRYLERTPGSQVINMASATAIYGQPDLATYSATKFMVRGLSEALALEWGAAGIRVSDIWPSFVRTPMARGFDQIPSARALGVRLAPDDVAAAVWRCATTRYGRGKTHWTVGVQAGLMAIGARLGPQAMTRQVVRLLAR